MKQFYYITFGQSHTHSFNGITIDKDIVVAVKCETKQRAMSYAWEMFGSKWAQIYEEFHAEHYPRGVIEVEL